MERPEPSWRPEGGGSSTTRRTACSRPGRLRRGARGARRRPAWTPRPGRPTAGPDAMVAMDASPRDSMAESGNGPRVSLESGKEARMPLRDHFRPPVEDKHSWDELHGGWPMVIARHLFPIL